MPIDLPRPARPEPAPPAHTCRARERGACCPQCSALPASLAAAGMTLLVRPTPRPVSPPSRDAHV